MKELNIFYKAPFGKLYKTRSGRKAIFVGRKSKYLYYLIVEGSPKYLTYFEYGRKFEDNDSNELSDYDIVSEWDSTIKKENNIDKECIDLYKYIPKAAVLAEIGRRLEVIANSSTENSRELSAIKRVRQQELINLIQYIYTLEVKEVDLNEEIEKCLKQYHMIAVGKEEFEPIAKHFFEIGLNAQKGE